ncbi:MAG TPA: hypothetical protein VEX11_01385 [Acetobacteraceae bacterium]|jgi:hypothetical protein|nr:hypothetical protein [Acetobacteraceae bacterium]
MLHAALRRGAVLVAVLAYCAPLLGCAGSGGPGAATATDRSGRFEGWYQGRQFPSNTNPHSACRSRAREVWFKVEDGNIEMRNNRHRRNRRKLSMLGTVSADGSVAMRQGEGGRSVVGRIQNDRLTAATVQDAQDLQAVQGGGRVPCSYRYEATRRPGEASTGHNPSASASTYGPPPI